MNISTVVVHVIVIKVLTFKMASIDYNHYNYAFYHLYIHIFISQLASYVINNPCSPGIAIIYSFHMEQSSELHDTSIPLHS